MTIDALRTRVEGWPEDLVATAVRAALARYRPDITPEERPALARMIAMAPEDPDAPDPPFDAATAAAIHRALQKRLA